MNASYPYEPIGAVPVIEMSLSIKIASLTLNPTTIMLWIYENPLKTAVYYGLGYGGICILCAGIFYTWHNLQEFWSSTDRAETTKLMGKQNLPAQIGQTEENDSSEENVVWEEIDLNGDKNWVDDTDGWERIGWTEGIYGD